MKVNDVTYNVWIEDQPWENKDGASVDEIHIIERYEYSVPVLIITLIDTGNLIGSKFHIDDGTKITVEWGQGSSIFKHDFRVATVKFSMYANSYVYRINAWYDNVKWLVDCNNKSYKGTSSEVIKKLAEESGMKAECDETNDSQTWIGGNQSNFKFARTIAKKGYGGEESLMGLSTCLGVVRYRDMNKLDEKGPLLGFVLGLGSPTKLNLSGFDVNCLAITTFKVHLKSGVYNLMNGYKTIREDPNIDSPDKETKYDTTPIKSRTSGISINEDIKSQVTTPKVTTGRIKTDNTHDNYNGADYANGKGTKVLRNAKVEFTTNQLTNLSPFDPIVIQLSGVNTGATGSPGNQNVAFDGPYIVYCRTIYISGSTFAEKIVCEREGMNK